MDEKPNEPQAKEQEREMTPLEILEKIFKKCIEHGIPPETLTIREPRPGNCEIRFIKK